MAIVARDEHNLIIASRRVKLPSGRFYYPLGSIYLTTKGEIKTTCLNVLATSFSGQLHFQVETLEIYSKHTSHDIKAYSPSYPYSIARVTLPNNMTKRQVKQVQDFLDTYFNNK